MRELVISPGRTGYLALYSCEEEHDTVLAIRHQREAGYCFGIGGSSSGNARRIWMATRNLVAGGRIRRVSLVYAGASPADRRGSTGRLAPTESLYCVIQIVLRNTKAGWELLLPGWQEQ